MNYSGIINYDVVNGKGFRTTLFVSGCCHNCKGCHNAEQRDKNYGNTFTDEIKSSIIEMLSSQHIDGLTLSGGDPLYESNLDEIDRLIDEVRLKLPNKTIWIYSGYVYEDLDDRRKEIVNKCDVMVDGRYIEELRDLSLPFMGSSNQRIIQIKEVL